MPRPPRSLDPGRSCHHSRSGERPKYPCRAAYQSSSSRRSGVATRLTPVVLRFGIGEISKILIIVYTTMLIVLINTMVGLRIFHPQRRQFSAGSPATRNFATGTYRTSSWAHAISRSATPQYPADDQALALIENFLDLNAETMPSFVVTVLNINEDQYR
jgi:hypothetical protein